MQFGALTDNQIALFELYQSESVRKPTSSVWIEGMGDPTDYLIEFDTESILEVEMRRPQPGSALLVMDNSTGVFYANGESLILPRAKAQIWAGFRGLNIPIFTGVVISAEPIAESNIVFIYCRDYLQLFRDMLVFGSQTPNDSFSSIIEGFCDALYLETPDIPSTSETANVYESPSFDEQSALEAIEQMCNSIFYVPFFSETGVLTAREREYLNKVDYEFNERNTIDASRLKDSHIINRVRIEYDDGFHVEYLDQSSIDEYHEQAKSLSVHILNSVLVSEFLVGGITESLDYDLEGFSFVSSSEAATIDTIRLRLKEADAAGILYLRIYSDSGGSPDSLVGTSEGKGADELNVDFAWEEFRFIPPVDISPSTDYWGILDLASISSGNVYTQINPLTASSQHVHYWGGGWVLEDNKRMLHQIRGSLRAKRVAEDLVEFFGTPSERINVTAPGIPQLQLMDVVMVDLPSRGIRGQFVIEKRKHIRGPAAYTTIDTLRKTSKEE